MNFVSVRKINQKEIRKRKKEVPRAPPDHFLGYKYPKNTLKKRQNFAPRRLLKKKRYRGRFLAPTS